MLAIPFGSLAGFVTALALFGSSLTSGQKLDRALEAIQLDHLRTDLTFIASDEMQGRDTPSPGLDKTAEYLALRCKEIGLQPGGPDGYFYGYPMSQRATDVKNSSVVLKFSQGDKSVRLTLLDDYIFYRPGNLELSGSGVYCGWGKPEDYKDNDLSGKWAVTKMDPRISSRRDRYAQSAHAAGLIVLPNPEVPAEEFQRTLGRFARSLVNPRLSFPRSDAPKAPFPSLFISPAGAEKIYSLLGVADPKEWSPEPGAPLGIEITETRKTQGDGRIELRNVCAFWRGDDPKLAEEVIVVSAHYDHVGARDGKIFNGADDNGSGTTGLLGVAEALAAHGPLRRSVLLMWVSGEEKGLYGSRAWTQKPWLPQGCRAVANINIDMIGRNPPDKLLLTPTSGHKAYNGMAKIAEQCGAQEGFPQLGSADSFWNRSDHINFWKMGIPTAFLFSGLHDDYHKETDTVEKIDFDKIQRVTRMVVRMLAEVQTDELNLLYETAEKKDEQSSGD